MYEYLCITKELDGGHHDVLGIIIRINIYVKHNFFVYLLRVATHLIFIVPCIVIFYGITNRCHNVQ
jgi:hypothetical protein